MAKIDSFIHILLFMSNFC